MVGSGTVFIFVGGSSKLWQNLGEYFEKMDVCKKFIFYIKIVSMMFFDVFLTKLKSNIFVKNILKIFYVNYVPISLCFRQAL